LRRFLNKSLKPSSNVLKSIFGKKCAGKAT
jgi:hypothetical protein